LRQSVVPQSFAYIHHTECSVIRMLRKLVIMSYTHAFFELNVHATKLI